MLPGARFQRRQISRDIVVIVSLIVLFLFSVRSGRGHEPLPARYVDKVDATPDFCQTDNRFGKFPGNGSHTCGPVALSNALVWLDQHGFPKILNTTQPTAMDQANLIRRLCTPEFLSTDAETGTSPKLVVEGIERFFKTTGYGCQIEQMSWRNSLHRIGTIPDETWMLKSCMGQSSLLINVGWYKNVQHGYRRMDGHWVTLVGFKEENGSRVLLIHDPSHHSGTSKKSETCKLIPLPGNHTLHGPKNQSVSAQGYFHLHGIHVKHTADLAIIDGAVAFAPHPHSDRHSP